MSTGSKRPMLISCLDCGKHKKLHGKEPMEKSAP